MDEENSNGRTSSDEMDVEYANSRRRHEDDNNHHAGGEDVDVKVAANAAATLTASAATTAQIFHSLFGDGASVGCKNNNGSNLTVILQETGSQLSDDDFDDLLTLVRQRRRQLCPASSSSSTINDDVTSWKRLVIRLPIYPDAHYTKELWIGEDYCRHEDRADSSSDNGGSMCHVGTPRQMSLNLTSEQNLRFINMIGNQRVRIHELYIVGNNRIDNLIVPLLLGRMEHSTLTKLKWIFSYGRQWPIEQLGKFASALRQQDQLRHVELTNLDFLWPPSEKRGQRQIEQQPQRPPLDILLESLQSSSNLRTLIVQMKHGSNLRHLIRQPSWDHQSSDEPFHTAEGLGGFIHHHPRLEHIELLNWDISDMDCRNMAESFRFHHDCYQNRRRQEQIHVASTSIGIGHESMQLKTIILSHYHQSLSCNVNGTTTDGLRNLLTTCLAPAGQVESFTIIPSLPWTRTRSDSNQMSTINGCRQLETLILALLRDNCYIKRLCVAVPGVVFSQSTICQIEVYETLNQAGRRYWRTNDDLCHETWLKIISQMALGIGPDGQEHSMSTLPYTNDMIFVALKETYHRMI